MIFLKCKFKKYMSLCGHHFVIVPFQTAQKLSPQFFEKERPRVHACVHVSSTCVHTYIYMCSFKWNDSILLLQTFEWSEFSFIYVFIQLVYFIVWG
jgi:hypothetical protein